MLKLTIEFNICGINGRLGIDWMPFPALYTILLFLDMPFTGLCLSFL
jgi:hypothetical protein